VSQPALDQHQRVSYLQQVLGPTTKPLVCNQYHSAALSAGLMPAHSRVQQLPCAPEGSAGRSRISSFLSKYVLRAAVPAASPARRSGSS
jgi:hypothetical protein